MMTPEGYAKNPTEHAQQTALFMWASLVETRAIYPELQWMHAIPNGGLRNPATAAMLKAEGAKKGVLDVFLPVARGGFFGLYIEFKRPKDEANVKGNKRKSAAGDLTPEQIEFRAFAWSQGYGCAVAFTYAEARAIVEAYMAQPSTPR